MWNTRLESPQTFQQATRGAWRGTEGSTRIKVMMCFGLDAAPQTLPSVYVFQHKPCFIIQNRADVGCRSTIAPWLKAKLLHPSPPISPQQYCRACFGMQQRFPWLRRQKRSRQSLLPPCMHQMRWCKMRQCWCSRGSQQDGLLHQRRPEQSRALFRA